MGSIPSFHRDRYGFWREVSRAEHDRIMTEIERAACPSGIRFPGDEIDAVCHLRGAHLGLHEDATGTRRWWVDHHGDDHISAKPGSPALLREEAAS